LKPDKITHARSTTKSDKLREPHDSKEITIPLDDDMDRYLRFLENIRLVRHKEDAALAALNIYKKLNMHDWLPYVYRTGTERVLLVSKDMLNDIFTSISEEELYNIAKGSALKRRLIKVVDSDINFRESENWDLVLNELENLGWGKFTRDNNVIMVEFLGIPITFLKGYLENLFGVEFKHHQTRSEEVYVLSKEKDKVQIWK
jgi:hypothetical protein